MQYETPPLTPQGIVPTRLLASSQVAQALGMSRPTAQRLINTGVLGRPMVDGQRIFVYPDVVLDIAERPLVDVSTLPPALIIKAGEPTVKWGVPIGWNHLERNKAKRRARALHSLDIAAKESDLIGHLAVITVSGVAVDTSRIVDIKQKGRGTARLIVEDDQSPEANAWRGQRTVPIPGGMIYYNHIEHTDA